MGIIRRFLGKATLRKQVGPCVDAAMKIIFVNLAEKYTAQYGESKGMALSVAVTNELFGRSPSKEEAQQFLAENKDFVESHLRDLKTKPEICQIVSMLGHITVNIAGNTGGLTENMVEWAMKLEKMGLLIPVEQVSMPKSVDEMRQQIRDFELWSISDLGYRTG